MRRKHFAIYGNVMLERAWCRDCQGMTLIVRGVKQCCERDSLAKSKAVVRMACPEMIRARPPLKARRQILADQGHCCLYCQRSFGSVVRRKSRNVRLSCCWDHLVPWSHTQDNRTQNFAAACQICNTLKSNLIFHDLEQARAYVNGRSRVEEAETDSPVSAM